MMKRIIALLLALILTVGLLPTVALAAGETKTAEEPSGVDFVKKLVTKNGKDYLCLEALVNGDIKTVKSVTPCDIVLVLDQSGSMNKTVKQTTYTYKEVDCKEWSYNKVREYLKNGTKLYYQSCSQCGEAHEVQYWKKIIGLTMIRTRSAINVAGIGMYFGIAEKTMRMCHETMFSIPERFILVLRQPRLRISLLH